MYNYNHHKRQKKASEKTWSTLEEESKQSLVQMLQFTSDDDKHEQNMKNVVQCNRSKNTALLSSRKTNVNSSWVASRQNIVTSSNPKRLKTTTEVASLKKKAEKEVEEEGSSKKNTNDITDQEYDQLVSGVLEKGEIDRMCLMALFEAEAIIGLCSHCGGDKFSCNDVQYGPHCIHSVMDYYEEVGINNFTEEGIEENYKRTFVVLKRHEIFKKTRKYEMRKQPLSLPKCMVNGSLHFSKRLLKMRKSFVHLISMRRYDNPDEAITNIDNNDKVTEEV